VILIEAGPRILPAFPQKLASRAMRDLEGLGVQVWAESMVTAIDAEGVQIGKERVEAATALWAAGVRASELGERLGVPLDRQGRVVVRADLSLEGRPEVFAIGDLACARDEKGEPYPGLAPVALQEGAFAARAILRDLAGEPRGEFRYFDKGQAATIGRSKAVVALRGLRFSGFLAWLVWLAVHIYYLVGFKNRLFVVLQWAWSYLTFRRGARLIVGPEQVPEGPGSQRIQAPLRLREPMSRN
jgi:NADH dehydrogenase